MGMNRRLMFNRSTRVGGDCNATPPHPDPKVPWPGGVGRRERPTVNQGIFNDFAVSLLGYFFFLFPCVIFIRVTICVCLLEVRGDTQPCTIANGIETEIN